MTKFSSIFFLAYLATNFGIEQENFLKVSVEQLITTPEKYDGKEIHVVGYLNLQFEENALYMNKSDYENRNYKKGIWVSLSTKQALKVKKVYNNKQVSIVGTFNATMKGHFGLWSGSIEKIKHVRIEEN